MSLSQKPKATLHVNEQLLNKATRHCVHYNGSIQNDACAAGVRYNDVKLNMHDDRATLVVCCGRIPGVNGGTPKLADRLKVCNQCKLLSPKAAQEKALKDERDLQTNIEAIDLIAKDVKEKKKQEFYEGEIPCPRCKGKLKYVYHGSRCMRAVCETKDCIRMMS